MGFVRKNLGVDLTGGGQRRAIEEGARLQEEAGREALGMLRSDLAPFRQAGVGALGGLQQLVGQPGVDSPQIDPLQLPTLDIQQDPSRVLNNPFFQALARDQEERLIQQQAALGRAGSGETGDLLTRNLLLLGNQLQQQDIDRQLQEFGIRSGQAERQFQTGADIAQTDFSNRLAAQQARFNQLFNLANLGQSAAAQTGVGGAGILQGIGNVQAAGQIGRSQVGNPLASAALGAGLGAIAGPAGLLGSRATTAGKGALAGLLGLGG